MRSGRLVRNSSACVSALEAQNLGVAGKGPAEVGAGDFDCLERGAPRAPLINKVLGPQASGVHTTHPHRPAAGSPPLTGQHALSLLALCST